MLKENNKELWEQENCVKKKNWVFSVNRNSKEISKEGRTERRKIISEGRSKMQKEIVSLENDKHEVNINIDHTIIKKMFNF